MSSWVYRPEYSPDCFALPGPWRYQVKQGIGEVQNALVGVSRLLGTVQQEVDVQYCTGTMVILLVGIRGGGRGEVSSKSKFAELEKVSNISADMKDTFDTRR